MGRILINRPNIIIPRRKFLAGMGMAAAGAMGVRANPTFFGLNQAASGGGSLLLDSIGTSAFAAYSVSRKLRSAYAGSAFRIRLASDNSEFDIGFDGSGNLNKTYLESTAAGTDAFIKIIYDQSGNGRDISNTTTSQQPKIVSAGTCLLGSNGRAAATFDGTDDFLQTAALTLNQPATYFTVLNNVTTTVGDYLVTGGFGTLLAVRQTTGNHLQANSGAALSQTDAYSLNTWYVFRVSFISSTGEIRQNAGSVTSGSVSSNAGNSLLIGHTSLCASFKFSEWIVYNSAIGTTDETTVRDNINSFYTLF